MMKLSISLAIILSFILFIPSLESADTQKLSRDQLLKIRTKISEYKKNRDYKARKPIVDDVAAMGPFAASQLYKVIEKEVLSIQKRYTASLGKKAKAVFRNKLNRTEEKEVKEARKVLAMLRAKDQALGKAEIVEKGDPALERLKELLLISPDSIISENENLKSVRNDILTLGGYMESCQKIMPEETQNSHKNKKKYGKKNLVPPQEKIPFITKLERDEKVAIILESLAQKKDVKILKNNEKQTQYIDYKESLGILDLNIMRMLAGLSPLEIDIKLCAAARDHSNDMRTKNFFAHQSPVKGKKNPADRARNWGTTADGENIAYGLATPEGTNMQWFHSPGHHVNMLRSEYTVMGLGRSEKYWTQMFRR